MKIAKDNNGVLEVLEGTAFNGSYGMPEIVSRPSTVTVYEAVVELEYFANMFYPYFDFRGCSYIGELLP